MEKVLAKGVNFLYSKKFIESEYGVDTWEKVIKSLPEDAQSVWDGALLVHQSYSFSAFKAMISALTVVLGSVKDSELAKIYEYIADQSLNKIYKIFFHFANPSFVIRNYPKLWDKFFNTGNVEVPVAEKGHAELKFTLPEIFLDWLAPACLGYSKKAVEMAGGKNLTMKELSRQHLSQNLWEIVYELMWSE
ncbi:MAG: hypothetical protein HZA11_04800 [Nitrospirae bacterium]|nr:hypothetical protein [Nitrospirota bacterium]